MKISVEDDMKFTDLKNEPAWGLVRTHGSMFFLEVGEKLAIANRRNPRGEWHFLVEMCHWRLETPDAVLVGSDDNIDVIDKVFGDLSLGVVSEMTVRSPGHCLQLDFSSRIQLKTFTTSATAQDEWIQWRLFRPDGKVWVVNGSGLLTLQNGDE
jgi:hypothetical protein